MGCSEDKIRGKCIAINVYIQKEESSQISNLIIHFKEIVKGKHTIPSASREDIKKIRADIHK